MLYLAQTQRCKGTDRFSTSHILNKMASLHTCYPWLNKGSLVVHYLIMAHATNTVRDTDVSHGIDNTVSLKRYRHAPCLVDNTLIHSCSTLT